MSLMLNLKNRLTNCTGAEVRINADGTLDIRWVKLSLDKKLVHIEAKKRHTSTLQKIEEPPLGNLAVTLTGKGILLKKTKKIEELTEHNLQHIFPNFKLPEFYVQNFISGEDSFIAIIRKETVDSIIQVFEKQGMKILVLSLGPFLADQVIPQLNIYGQTLYFDGHHIALNEDKNWKDYHFKVDAEAKFTIKIDMEVIPEHFILAYAAAFQLLLHQDLDVIEVDAPLIKNNLLELAAKLKFEKNGALALGGFFLLLLINFMVFSFFNSSNQELAGRAGQQSDLSANREKLETEVKEKESEVKKLGWNRGLSYAFICDQLGQRIPKSIVLTELSVNEPDKLRTGVEKEVVYEPGKIKITGEAANIYAINDCIFAFKQLHWVKDVQLEKYVTDDQKQTQVFTLLLNY
ncbi:hypothetical protein DBR11_07460 [Pedobacter sp. HMWF019]|nr:hypothetical protein DBR11_07460 [Pedobacter sp. HMWF019]